MQPGLGEPVDLEWVQEHWGEVTSLEGARPMWNNRFSLDEWAEELAKAEQS